MRTSLIATSLVTRPSRVRRFTFLALGVCVLTLLIALMAAVGLASLVRAETPFVPGEADGVIAEGTEVSLSDEQLPAIAGLDEALKQGLRAAETDATRDGIRFEVTSGWRSAAYQQWLLDDATRLYASEEIARQFVATPERSSHVTGDAVDIGPIDAQFWLIEHGAAYGICQTYANERWHFQLATTPGGVCPEMKMDAAS